MKNIFIYWIEQQGYTRKWELINILRELMYLHSDNGKNYNLHFVNHDNINNYITNEELPNCFYQMCPPHQADYIRILLIYKYGGIWLDSDTIVLTSLKELFDILEEQDGFFINDKNNILINSVFGSKKNNPLFKKILDNLNVIIQKKGNRPFWTELGSQTFENIKKKYPLLFNNYKIFYGPDSMYPVYWDKADIIWTKKEFNYAINLVKTFQPLIILCNSVYGALENLTETQILEKKTPLTYFIQKSKNLLKN